MSGPLANLGALHADRAVQVDAVICGLVKKAAELGELEVRQVLGVDGPREIKVPPPVWFARLERALEVGAFDRLSIEEIIDRILLPLGEGAKA